MTIYFFIFCYNRQYSKVGDKMARMRLKKKHSIKWVLIPIVILLIFGILKLCGKQQFHNSNSPFVKQLLQDSNYHLIYEKQDRNLLGKFISFFSGGEPKEPVSFLETVFAYQEQDLKEEEIPPLFSYINNLVVDTPRIYIYSTHPTEGYTGEKVEGYDIAPGVLMASAILQDKLNAIGLPTIVEENSAATYIKEHNLSYEDSYIATREFVSNMLKKQSNFDLIIDLHRDAGIPKSTTTAEINGKSYAKIMFVMKNTLPNIEKAQKISDIAERLYPGISRGIYDKRNSKFNQDLNENMVLMELGSNHNTVEEVLNTIDALTNIIKEYLDER